MSDPDLTTYLKLEFSSPEAMAKFAAHLWDLKFVNPADRLLIKTVDEGDLDEICRWRDSMWRQNELTKDLV